MSIQLSGNTPIEELELSNRTYNSLKRNGIRTVESLLSFTQEELMRLYNFGETMYADVHKRLSHLRLIDPDNVGIVPIVEIPEEIDEEDWDPMVNCGTRHVNQRES